MILKVFSIRDSKGLVFNTPFFAKTHGEAERNFEMLVRDVKSLPAQYPDDFDLYFVGQYDDDTGLLVPVKTPEHVVKGVSVLQRDKRDLRPIDA